MTKILYLSYDGMTDPLGQSQVLPYLAGLSKLGYQFTLISFEKGERIEKGKAIIEKICKDNSIEWHPLVYTKSPPILSTLKDVRALRKKIKELQLVAPFSIVHCRSYITAMAGLWMQKKWKTRFIFDMRGFWADERVDGGIWNLKNPLFKMVFSYFKKKEIEFFSKADHTISLTHNAEQVIHKMTAIANQPIPITVIPCCVDMELFDPATITTEAIDKVKQDLNIPADAVVLSYIGSIGTWYMLEEMLAFFKQFLLKKPDSIFLFVTNEAAASILIAAEKAGIQASSLRITFAVRKEVPLYIAVCNYSVFFIKPVFSKRASSPTKQGEIMAMGKPLICNTNVGDTDYVVNKYQSGVLVNAFNKDEYDKAIEEIAQAQQFSTTAIINGAKEFFSLDKGIKSYAEVYQTVLNEN